METGSGFITIDFKKQLMKKSQFIYINPKNLIRNATVWLFLGLLLFNSCSKDKALPELIIPTRVGFTNTSIVIAKDAGSPMPLTLTLARPLERAGTVTIEQVAGSTTAADSEFSISPAFSSGKLTIDLPQGASQASFTLTSLHNFDDNKVIVFRISKTTGGAVLNETNLTATVTMRGNKWIDPAVLPSLTTLADFGNVNTGTESASKSYTLSGLNLRAPLTVTASANFKVSLNNTVFSSSLSVDVNNKTATIYVKFTPASKVNQKLTGTITHTLTDLADVVVALSGTEVGNVPYIPEVPLLNDNFEYGASSDFITRVTGNWTAYSAAGMIPVIYMPQGMTFASYAGSGIGGSVTIEHGDLSREDIARSFAQQTAGTTYAALMINLSKAGEGDFFYSLRDASGGFFNRLYAKDGGGGNLSLGIGKSSTVQYSTVNYKYNTTYLVVIKYDFTAKISSMYLFDGVLPDTEPMTPAAVSLATGTSPANLADIVIRQSDGVLSANLDGVRVATTWRGVLGL
jgi:hypothetical protein